MITVKVNNKQYTFKFTIWTIERACELAGVGLNDYDEFMKSNNVKGILTLYRAALERGTDGKICLNNFEIDDLIEQMKKEDFFDIYKDYLNSIEQIAVKVTGFKDVKKN